jgi:membrane protease YdiL (CAAX protease family)
MQYCPGCSSEYRPGFVRCSDCDLDLVAELPPAPTPSQEPARWVPIFLGSFSRAEAVRGSLEAAGIPTLYPDEQLQTLGWFSPSTLGRAHLLVPEEDLQEAQRLIEGGNVPEAADPSSAAPGIGHPLTEAGPPPSASPRPLSLFTLFRRTAVELILAVSLPIALVTPFHPGSGWGQQLLILLLLEPAFLVVALWRRRSLAEAGEPVAPFWKGSESDSIPLGIFVGGLQAGVSLLYAKMLLGGTWDLLGTDSHPETRSMWHVLNIISAVGIAPVCEETFFRGGILGAYAVSGRKGWGLFISSLLFSAMHGSLIRSPLFFFDGLLLGWLYLRGKSLRAPLIAHITVNAVLSLWSFFW